MRSDVGDAGDRGAAPAGVHRVAVLLLPTVIGFDATIPPMIFSTANENLDGDRFYEVTLCGLSTEAVRASTGYALVPAAGPEALDDADTVIVPGTRYRPARRDGIVEDEVAAALARVPAHARLVSICTGAFVLAAAGLLNGRRATTHWQYADDFRELFPAVTLDENVLFVEDGPVFTSAGLAAGLDLCLHLIRTDLGSRVANDVARHCVVAPWREGGQAQFIAREEPHARGQSTAEVRQWALENLAEPLSVRQLADRACMSVRTFNRRFREETGLAPGEWVRSRRLDHARELLEHQRLPIDEVARRCGLGTAANLRHHMRRGVGMSPTGYRRTYLGA
ncbi:GlxA family transcriptional regulator [Millisia brevis]|uniref:GlxA family transcriptional regulator n=1 Tax=Millisia brevis TaxID=264148 RepID=UPI000AC2184A|nr:helix-turn-helix domain-containing protein [Millisia brevis]